MLSSNAYFYFLYIHIQYKNHEWLAESVILAAKNADVNDLNLKIHGMLPGELMSYTSIDTVCGANAAVNYTTEFLNSLDLPGNATAPSTTES
jgi:hypothetical protein